MPVRLCISLYNPIPKNFTGSAPGQDCPELGGVGSGTSSLISDTRMSDSEHFVKIKIQDESDATLTGPPPPPLLPPRNGDTEKTDEGDVSL